MYRYRYVKYERISDFALSCKTTPLWRTEMKEMLRDKGRPGKSAHFLHVATPSFFLQYLCVAHCELNLLNHIESKLSPCSLYIYLLPLQIFLRISISSFLVPSLVATRHFHCFPSKFWASYGFLAVTGVLSASTANSLAVTQSKDDRHDRRWPFSSNVPDVSSNVRCVFLLSIAVQVAEKETGGLADLLSVSGIFGC